MDKKWLEEEEDGNLISVDDADVPAWQRQTVWTDDEMGLLAYSIIRRYPIGSVILWQKANGVRVPIDGRQRLTAIQKFHNGEVAIPELPSVEKAYHRKKFALRDGDKEGGFSLLSSRDRENFEDYELSCIEYQDLDETIAMDIFVMLQGGKALTKTEVRAALGGELCEFVTELTSGTAVQDEEADEELSKHEFFKMLAKNMPNRRKAHRNMADIMVHEILYPGEDKHWSSLETMYRDKAHGLTRAQKNACHSQIRKFLQASHQAGSNAQHLITTRFFLMSNVPDPHNFDPDDNFAHSFHPQPEDLDEDAALESVVWQFLLLINPGDEDAAAAQFAEVREALVADAEPLEAIRAAIDWKAGFFTAESDLEGIVEAVDELAARVGVRIDWEIDDEADEPFADEDATSLLQRAAVQLREHGYTLWSLETGTEMVAGWIAQRADDEAVPTVAGALGFHARAGV